MADRRLTDRLRGRRDALCASRRTPVLTDIRTLRRDVWEEINRENAKAVAEELSSVREAGPAERRAKSIADDLRKALQSEMEAAGVPVDPECPPLVPPCTITYGCNEYGTLESWIHFEGDEHPIGQIPAQRLEDITNDYIIGLYVWSRNPHDDLGDLPECSADRADVKPNSVAVMLPIPPEVADQFPVLGKSMPPHVTMAYLGEVDPGKVESIVLMVADEFCIRWMGETQPVSAGSYFEEFIALDEIRLTLAGLGYFDNEDERVAFASVVVPPPLRTIRERLLTRFKSIGIESDRPNWTPHATLAYLQPGQNYEGEVPKGEWQAGTIEVWHGNDVRYILGKEAVSGVDKLERVGAKWKAFRDAGRTYIGDFGSEAEAREGLKADDVDRRLTGRHDESGQPDEATIKAWLVEHISDDRKMPRPRMLQLKALEDKYPYLKPPPVGQVFRGLRNIEPSAVSKWPESSDAVMDKSWSAKREPAERFAAGEWTLEQPIEGKTGVLLTATAEPKLLLLNPDLLADLPGVGDVVHPIWNEPLSKAIRDEQEVLALDSLAIKSAEAVPMVKRKADAAHRRTDVADARQQVLFDTEADGAITIRVPSGIDVALNRANLAIAHADAAAAAATSVTRRAPAVHTESRVHVAEVIRADRIELPTDHKPISHPDGWVMYPVLYSRAGNIQVYGDIREYRPPEEVFDRSSMDSGIGVPWELRHSDDLLNPRTIRGVGWGAVCTVDQYHDGEHTFGWARAWDHALIEAIEGVDGRRPEAPEVSVAYRCKVDQRPGTDDWGNPFDQRQFNIIWNSLASEPHGRAQTARVLTGRSDSADGITIHGANELLALALGRQPPSKPVFFDPGSWTRFDAAKGPRPTITHKDESPVTNKALIMTAKKVGVSDDAIASAIGMAAEDLDSFMKSDDELTPDQVNALIGILPADVSQDSEEEDEKEKTDEDKAKEDMDPGKKPKEDMDPDREDEDEKPKADEETVRITISEGEEKVADEDDKSKEDMDPEVEYEVPKPVAEHIEVLEEKLVAAEERADRAGKRTSRAEAALAKAERELAAAKTELAKRSDAMKGMVTRADAEKMVQRRAASIAEAMSLAHRSFGNEWRPTPRKDSATGEALPLSAYDWQMAAIRGAFGEKAQQIISRIDAAPNAAAREYAIQERLADAREILDRRDHKGMASIQAIERMRASNASADRLEESRADALEAARQEQINLAGQYRTAPTA